jgi:hypothetical protein
VLIKASLLTASGMLFHVFPSMFVSSLREFPENCVKKHDEVNCFIEYLHRKLLSNQRMFLFLLYLMNIDYSMAFFISYTLSALGHDISLRADRLKG